MPSTSIIIPHLEPNYDLVYLTPLQAWLAPYEVWISLCLWSLFALCFFHQFYRYLIAPYLHESDS